MMESMDDHVRRALFYTVLVAAKDGAEEKVMPVFNEVARLGEKPEKEFVECLSRLAIPMGEVEPLLDSQFGGFEKLDPSVRVVSWEDPEWPKQTLGSGYCPRFLYLKGDVSLLARPLVSVIGTRTPDLAGKRLCVETVKALGECGLVPASGLALGINGVVHRSALQLGLPSVCVIGTPIDQSYPMEHQSLQESVAQKGLVVSRFAPSLPTQKWYFLVRNRLMSLLSSCCVVVAEKDGGGAVSQAEYCLQLGRKVCLYQGTVDNYALLWPRKLKEKGGVEIFRDPQILAKALAGEGKKKVSRPKRKVEKKEEKAIQLSLF